MKGTIDIDQELCKGCEVCVEFCPQNIIAISEKRNAAGYQAAAPGNEDECTGCALCSLVCPEVAIEVYRG